MTKNLFIIFQNKTKSGEIFKFLLLNWCSWSELFPRLFSLSHGWTLDWTVAIAGLQGHLHQDSHQKSCRPALSPCSCPWFQRRPSKLPLLLLLLELLLPPQLRLKVLQRKWAVSMDRGGSDLWRSEGNLTCMCLWERPASCLSLERDRSYSNKWFQVRTRGGSAPCPLPRPWKEGMEE